MSKEELNMNNKDIKEVEPDLQEDVEGLATPEDIPEITKPITEVIGTIGVNKKGEIVLISVKDSFAEQFNATITNEDGTTEVVDDFTMAIKELLQDALITTANFGDIRDLTNFESNSVIMYSFTYQVSPAVIDGSSINFVVSHLFSDDNKEIDSFFNDADVSLADISRENRAIIASLMANPDSKVANYVDADGKENTIEIED